MYYNENTYLTKEEIENLILKSKKEISQLEQSGSYSEYIKELSNLGLLQLEAGYYEESLVNLQICFKHFENMHDRLGQASIYGILGILHFNKGEYLKSLEDYNLALKIYKELNQIPEIISCLKGIAISLLKLNRLDEARDKFLECSKLCSEDNDIYNLLDCLGNLVYIYETKEKWDIVFELYQKSLEAFQKIYDNKGIITSYFNLGIIKKRTQDYEESIRYFKLGTNVAIDANYTELILKGLSYIGEILVYQGKLKDAKEQYIKALNLAIKINAKNSILQLKILLRSLGLTDLQIEDNIKKLTG